MHGLNEGARQPKVAQAGAQRENTNAKALRSKDEGVSSSDYNFSFGTPFSNIAECFWNLT
jgi:hypothetical protein